MTETVAGRSIVLHASLILLLVVVGRSVGQDICTQYTSCTGCISARHACVWCSDLPNSLIGFRCTSRGNANCTIPVEDPRASPPQILRNDILGDNVQIAPQKIALELRPGDPQTFTMSVKPSRNYPLDMYFLMDVSGSMSDDLKTLQDRSSEIVAALTNITSQPSLGFGSFLDKVVYPFSSILPGEDDYLKDDLVDGIICDEGREFCNSTISFRHLLSLTNSSSEFSNVLESVVLRGNVDIPEGGMDALVQVLSCPDIIGWRAQSLKLIMFMTDTGFKIALDGRLGAVMERNDGKCHLQQSEDGTYFEYLKDAELDFPSIYQVRKLLADEDAIIIFAVTDPNIYEHLSAVIGNRAFHTIITRDSSNIVSVINNIYEEVTQDVVIEDIDGITIKIIPGTNCTLNADGSGCANVNIEQLVTFNVTMTLTNCQVKGNRTLFLPGFGSVALIVTPLCECNCSSQEITNHTSCSDHGTLTCGVCTCNTGYFGEFCDCNQELAACPGHCSNRGSCDNCTRQCMCDTRPNPFGHTLGSYGERCQCDNSTNGACPNGANHEICAGRGLCGCDADRCACECACDTAFVSGGKQFKYFQPGCECDPNNCYNEDYPGMLCANVDTSGESDCTCDGCVCDADLVAFKKTCRTEDAMCKMFEECAVCGVNCTTVPECEPTQLTSTTGGGAVVCVIDFEGCKLDYHVLIDKEMSDAMIFVGTKRDCRGSSDSNLPWIIAVAIVGGILLLGLLVLIIAKIILLIVDRKDYKMFISQMHTAEWAPHENPLYVTPKIEYKNPLKRTRNSYTEQPLASKAE